MNLRISGIFTNPEYFFDLSNNFMQLLSRQIQKNILSEPLQGVKSKELEIYICTDGNSTESTIRKISKTDKGKYLSFHFWIAYPKVVRQVTENEIVDIDLNIFTKEFFYCVFQSLSNYGVSEENIKKTEEEILKELEQNKSFYTFEISPQQAKWRSTQKRILAELENLQS